MTAMKWFHKSGGIMNLFNDAFVLTVLVLLGGCVSTETYKKSQSETAQCLTDKRSLSQQLEAANQEKANLQQATQAKDEEISKLKGTYDDLMGNLKNEIASGQIQVTQLKDKLTVNMVEKILFNSGSARIKPEGMKVLDRVADALKKVQDKAIRVEGYTDNVPLSPKLQSTFPSNWELSVARAANVVRYLQEKDGLDPSHLIAAGYGEYHPVAPNDTEEGRAQNRRIDIVLVPLDVAVPASAQTPLAPAPNINATPLDAAPAAPASVAPAAPQNPSPQ